MIARSGMGLLTKKGGPKPDISTTESWKRALASAKSITYPSEGASGVYFVALIDKLGLTETLKPQLKPVPNAAGVVGIITRGEAEIGILPLSEIIPEHGVEAIGPFPPEVQGHIVMTAGVSAAAKQPGPARDLVKFLTAPSAATTIMEKHMEQGGGA